MIIKLVRHGQSEANAGIVNSTAIGDANVKCTTIGLQTAQDAGKFIGHKFLLQSLLYCSPYLRCKQTLHAIIDGSNAISHGNIPRIFEDPRLRESEFGYNKEEEDIASEKSIRNQHGMFYYRYHGGESPADVYDRISTFLETMMRQIVRKRTKSVLVVSHGITIRCFAMRFMHLTVEQFNRIKNPSHCEILTIAPLGRLMPTPQFTSGKWGISGLKFRT